MSPIPITQIMDEIEMAFNEEIDITKSSQDKILKTEIVLTPDQQEVFESIKKWLDDPLDDSSFVMTGYAGCGKTTLVRQILNWYFSTKNLYIGDICVSAPTHKALKVLRKVMADLPAFNKITFSTLHSLLGITPYIDALGREIFKKNDFHTESIGQFKLLIVDEASMIDNELFKELYLQRAQSKVKVLFVGDAKQIPPVNHTQSLPLMKPVQEKMNLKTGQLTTIVRQASNNPILKLATNIRESSEFILGDEDRSNQIVEDRGIRFLSTNDKKALYGTMRDYFLSEEFDKDPDYAKVLAWRNKTVGHFNNAIRAMKYGKDAPKIIVGEKLLTRRPIGKDDGVMANNNEDLEVISVTEKTTTYHETPIKYYFCQVHGETHDHGFDIKIIHEDSQKDYERVLERLSNTAQKAVESKQKKIAWKIYYNFMDTFAQVDYNYAITCHRSQGSTYNTAFVIYADIMFNDKVEERNRILYTAVTRPSHNLYII
jgi:exodeoxyribonuclease V